MTDAPIPAQWQDRFYMALEELRSYAPNPWPSHFVAAVERIAVLEGALRDILVITDRKHVVWDRARAALAPEAYNQSGTFTE